MKVRLKLKSLMCFVIVGGGKGCFISQVMVKSPFIEAISKSNRSLWGSLFPRQLDHTSQYLCPFSYFWQSWLFNKCSFQKVN